MKEATVQVAAALQGLPLVDLYSVDHGAMLRAPNNGVLALYQAAYWQAIAARLAITRGVYALPMVYAAQAALERADAVRSSWFGMFTGAAETTVGSARALQRAAVSVRSIPEVAAVLEQQARMVQPNANDARFVTLQRYAIVGAVASVVLVVGAIATVASPYARMLPVRRGR